MSYDDRPWLKSYDSGVRSEIDPVTKTLVEKLNNVAIGSADKPALHFFGVTLTFRQLMDHANRLAGALKERGLGNGDVVAVCMPNTPQYVISVIGALKAGCSVTGLSPLLTADEMAYQLNDCAAKALIIVDILFEKPFAAAADKAPGLKTVIHTGLIDFLPSVKRFLAKALKKVPSGKITPLSGKETVPFMEILKKYPPQDPKVRVSLDDTCFLQYTGGTTGMPKGAILTHRNIMSGIAQYDEVYKMQPGQDIYCSGLPMFHIAGLVVSLHALYFGSSQVLIPDPRNVDMILKEMVKYQPTFLVNVPTLYLMIAQRPEAAQVDWSRVRACFSGAAPFSEDGIKALEAVIGKGRLSELYGATESSPLIAMDQDKAPKRVGSVGLPMPSTKVRLVDAITGEGQVPLGEEGEIIVSGPQVMKGYHNKPEETANALREHDGEIWLHTGDVGRMDEDGYLYIVDRTKDMVIVGGYKVFSTEVENKLSEHPAIGMCAVVGAPNPDKAESEVVKLIVQKSPEYAASSDDEVRESILEFAREKLAAYKVPRIVEFMELPLTAVGKINKKELR
jgi:long-chain acyl-CoA synthetase